VCYLAYNIWLMHGFTRTQIHNWDHLMSCYNDSTTSHKNISILWFPKLATNKPEPQKSNSQMLVLHNYWLSDKLKCNYPGPGSFLPPQIQSENLTSNYIYILHVHEWKISQTSIRKVEVWMDRRSWIYTISSSLQQIGTFQFVIL